MSNEEYSKTVFKDKRIEVKQTLNGFMVIDQFHHRVLGSAQYSFKEALERAYSNIRGDIDLFDLFPLNIRVIILNSIIDCASQLEFGQLRTPERVKHLQRWKSVHSGDLSYMHRIEINKEYPEDITQDVYLVRTSRQVEAYGDMIDKQITFTKKAFEFDWERVKFSLNQFTEHPERY